MTDGGPDASLDDASLLEDWRAGDRARGNLLFRRHVGALTRFFRNKVPDRAEDLTQQTFLALVEREQTFRGEGSFRAFLFGIARNQLLMHLRRKRRGKEDFDPLTWSVLDAGASPARVVCRHQQQEVVARAMQRLPVDSQIALELHYFEGMPLADIAAVTGEPIGTVKSRLSRGRKLLREKVAEIATPGELLTSTVDNLDRWASSLAEVMGERGSKD